MNFKIIPFVILGLCIIVVLAELFAALLEFWDRKRKERKRKS